MHATYSYKPYNFIYGTHFTHKSTNKDIVSDLYQEIVNETENHKVYLTLIGLGERAKGIQFGYFHNFVTYDFTRAGRP